MSEINRSPPWTSVSLSLLLGTAAVLGIGVSVPTALPIGIVGLALLAIGMIRGYRSAVTLGAGVLFVAILLAGWFGASVGSVLLALLGTVVAWDVGENGISIGEQLGRDADTNRAELVHAGSSLLVGTVTATLAYGVYRAGTGGQPMTALVLLLLGAVALVSALQE